VLDEKSPNYKVMHHISYLLTFSFKILSMLDEWGSVPGRFNDGDLSLCHHIQTGSAAQPASYPMGTRVS